MNENVVALPGFKVPAPKGQPVEDVVEILEEMLQLAKAGQLVGIAASFVIDDGTDCEMIDHRIATRQHTAFALSAALRRLNYNFDETFFA